MPEAFQETVAHRNEKNPGILGTIWVGFPRSRIEMVVFVHVGIRKK